MRMENTCEIRFFVERDRHARDTRNIRRTKLPLLFETVSSVTSSSSNIKTSSFVATCYSLRIRVIVNKVLIQTFFELAIYCLLSRVIWSDYRCTCFAFSKEIFNFQLKMDKQFQKLKWIAIIQYLSYQFLFTFKWKFRFENIYSDQLKRVIKKIKKRFLHRVKVIFYEF